MKNRTNMSTPSVIHVAATPGTPDQKEEEKPQDIPLQEFIDKEAKRFPIESWKDYAVPHDGSSSFKKEELEILAKDASRADHRAMTNMFNNDVTSQLGLLDHSDFGYTLYTRKHIPKDTHIACYPGVFGPYKKRELMGSSDDHEYNIALTDGEYCYAQIQAEKTAGYLRYMPSLPALSQESGSIFLIGDYHIASSVDKSQIATSNLISRKTIFTDEKEHKPINNIIQLGFQTAGDISPSTVLGFCYGKGYWLLSRKTPALFYKNGCIVDPLLYVYKDPLFICPAKSKQFFYHWESLIHHLLSNEPLPIPDSDQFVDLESIMFNIDVYIGTCKTNMVLEQLAELFKEQKKLIARGETVIAGLKNAPTASDKSSWLSEKQAIEKRHKEINEIFQYLSVYIFCETIQKIPSPTKTILPESEKGLLSAVGLFQQQPEKSGVSWNNYFKYSI